MTVIDDVFCVGRITVYNPYAYNCRWMLDSPKVR